MIVCIAIDLMDQLLSGATNNGTLISARRFAHQLIEDGHQVRVVCAGDPSRDGTDSASGISYYHVPEFHIPLISWLAHRQGTAIARPAETVIRRALTGADILHIYEAWPMEAACGRIAAELKVPVLAAFHIQPENITYNLGLRHWPEAVSLAYAAMRRLFYQKYQHIHCPSQMIADELRRHGFKAQLHVVSNGVPAAFRPLPQELDLAASKKAASLTPPVPLASFENSAQDSPNDFRLLCVGRLAPEKSQHTVLEAIALSQHREQIKLLIAGRGPLEKKLRRQAERLGLRLELGYREQDELVSLMQQADLYLHPALVDIEGLSCLEACACAALPLISDSPLSASSQFALTESSVFRHDQPADLAAKIDFWLEHPRLRTSWRPRYARLAIDYSLRESVHRIEGVYQGIIAG
ncbi:MAG: glycosyltransferase [Coriobacteriales bacterium]|jgi:glycosyltransferase involved in cell wall biosynthesis|nr:glycosyltransferase [Coriobacteriales bacterium]